MTDSNLRLFALALPFVAPKMVSIFALKIMFDVHGMILMLFLRTVGV